MKYDGVGRMVSIEIGKLSGQIFSNLHGLVVAKEIFS